MDLKKRNINCTVLGKNLALSSAKYWAEIHGLSHGLWLWKSEARARGQVKPSSWLGFCLAYTTWLGLAFAWPIPLGLAWPLAFRPSQHMTKHFKWIQQDSTVVPSVWWNSSVMYGAFKESVALKPPMEPFTKSPLLTSFSVTSPALLGFLSSFQSTLFYSMKQPV